MNVVIFEKAELKHFKPQNERMCVCIKLSWTYSVIHLNILVKTLEIAHSKQIGCAVVLIRLLRLVILSTVVLRNSLKKI